MVCLFTKRWPVFLQKLHAAALNRQSLACWFALPHRTHFLSDDGSFCCFDFIATCLISSDLGPYTVSLATLAASSVSIAI